MIKKFTAAIITTALFFGLITGLIEAYASTGWLKGQWSSDLELVLPESPRATSSDISFRSIADNQDSLASPVDDIEDGMEPEEMEDTGGTEGTEEPEPEIEPSTPSDISITTDGATSQDSVELDEVANATSPVDDDSPVADRALEDEEIDESPVTDITLEDGEEKETEVATQGEAQ